MRTLLGPMTPCWNEWIESCSFLPAPFSLDILLPNLHQPNVFLSRSFVGNLLVFTCPDGFELVAILKQKEYVAIAHKTLQNGRYDRGHPQKRRYC